MHGAVGYYFKNCLQPWKGVAAKHGVSIANVAARYVLDRPSVAGVIIGARLGVTDHREDKWLRIQLRP